MKNRRNCIYYDKEVYQWGVCKIAPDFPDDFLHITVTKNIGCNRISDLKGNHDDYHPCPYYKEKEEKK